MGEAKPVHVIGGGPRGMHKVCMGPSRYAIPCGYLARGGGIVGRRPSPCGAVPSHHVAGSPQQKRQYGPPALDGDERGKKKRKKKHLYTHTHTRTQGRGVAERAFAGPLPPSEVTAAAHEGPWPTSRVDVNRRPSPPPPPGPCPRCPDNVPPTPCLVPALPAPREQGLFSAWPCLSPPVGHACVRG